MELHIFRGPGRVFGVTRDAAGSNLPPGLAPWASFKVVEMVRGQPMPGLDTDECLDDVERHGFHITDAHVRVTEQHVPR